jgi:hypothetical protein
MSAFAEEDTEIYPTEESPILAVPVGGEGRQNAIIIKI